MLVKKPIYCVDDLFSCEYYVDIDMKKHNIL